jgi:hypothetical protein
MVGPRPPASAASSVRSKASAEIKTPAPKAITVAMSRLGIRTNQAVAAPSTRAPPPSRPHSPATNHVGMRSLQVLGRRPRLVAGRASTSMPLVLSCASTATRLVIA